MLPEAFLVLVLSFVVFYLFLYLDSVKNRKNVPEGFPPGPTTLPLFDTFSFSTSNLGRTVDSLRTKFGDVVGLRFGSKNVVIISDYDLIQESNNTPALCGKFVTEVDTIIGEKHSLDTGASIPLDGGLDFEWTLLERKFILKTLRDFGFGPKTIESIIHQDVTELVTVFKTVPGKEVNPISWVQLAVFNSLLRFITSETLRQDDSRLKTLWEQFETVISAENFQLPTLLSQYLPAQLSGKKKLTKAVIFVEQFLRRKLAEHKSSLGNDDDHDDDHDDGLLRDFMEAYLEEIRETRNVKSPFYGEVGELNLILSCLNMISGCRKTCATILWAIYHIGKDTSIQTKLQKEIDRHIGIYRLPGIKDKLSMPYTEALMLETFRTSAVLPFGTPHMSTDQVTFHGYNIPQNTLILTNLHDVHHDSKHWTDPELFRPERFLTPDETHVMKAHRPVMWSTIAKGTSPNELLGSDNFFLYVTSIFQRFNVTVVGSSGKSPGPDMAFKVVLEDRLEFLNRNDKEE